MRTYANCVCVRQKAKKQSARAGMLAGMAIYHLSVKTISRSEGRSATAGAAYRAGVEIVDERTGEVHDYTRRSGVESVEITLPEGAPTWAADRSALWNAAEKAETRKNSTVAREYELALPDELNADQRRELVREFAKELAERHGVAVDAAIHTPGREGDHRNHHAHVLTSTRRLGPEGFTEKTRELDSQQTGPKEVEHWRERWAGMTNQALERAGQVERVDHRSLKAQRDTVLALGRTDRADELDRTPTRHLGPVATDDLRQAQARQTEPVTERARQHVEIVTENQERQSLLKRAREALNAGVERAVERFEYLSKGLQNFQARAQEWADKQLELAKGRDRDLAIQRERDGDRGMSR